MKQQIALAVHGGAWNIPDHLWPAHQEGCAVAYREGLKVLERGGPATEAVAVAIASMEEDPIFDAGIGSFLNENGEIELDAGLMEGEHLRSGAVLGVSQIKSPIALAHWILHHSDHHVFTGRGAHHLAEQAGLDLVPPDYHELQRERDFYNRIKADPNLLDTTWHDQPHDTVGAIARDQNGLLAAGNSTGGTPFKAEGRVGDAPIMGLGFYADNERGAFVCTGWGESIMSSAMGMTGLIEMQKHSPKEAANLAIDHLKRRAKGFGGILLMAPDGRCGVAYNTQRMAFHLPETL
jgi:beta-aspartyl-peptidase (threonine type)